MSTPMTKPAQKNKNEGAADRAAVLRWNAPEYVPVKRWWWYVAIGLITLALTAILIACGNWSAGLVALSAGLAGFVLYLPKPYIWRYSLDGTQLRATAGHRHVAFALDDFRSYAIVQLPPNGSGRPRHVVVLRPRGRLRRDIDVYLPISSAQERRVRSVLESTLGSRSISQVAAHAPLLVDRIARLFRLG